MFEIRFGIFLFFGIVFLFRFGGFVLFRFLIIFIYILEDEKIKIKNFLSEYMVFCGFLGICGF